MMVVAVETSEVVPVNGPKKDPPVTVLQIIIITACMFVVFGAISLHAMRRRESKLQQAITSLFLWWSEKWGENIRASKIRWKFPRMGNFQGLSRPDTNCWFLKWGAFMKQQFSLGDSPNTLILRGRIR
jgi:hypothetical protein